MSHASVTTPGTLRLLLARDYSWPVTPAPERPVQESYSLPTFFSLNIAPGSLNFQKNNFQLRSKIKSWHYWYSINDRIATQRYLTPEIPIGSPVMSRTTSEPSGRRSRKMVAIVAGCRSFRTFRDCQFQHCIHDRRTAIKFGTHIRIDMWLIWT